MHSISIPSHFPESLSHHPPLNLSSSTFCHLSLPVYFITYERIRLWGAFGAAEVQSDSAAMAVPVKALSKSCLSKFTKPLGKRSWCDSVMLTLSWELKQKDTMQLYREGQGSVLLLCVLMQCLAEGWGLQPFQFSSNCLREGLVHQPHCPCYCSFHLALPSNRSYSILEFLL